MIKLRKLPVTVRDLPLALGFGLAAVVPALEQHGTQLGDLPDRPYDALTVGVIALESLPLAVRRRFPAVCLALVSLGFAIDQFRGYHTVAGTGLAVALVSAGAYVERRRWVVVALASAAYVTLAISLDRLGSTEGVTGFTTFYLLLALAWGVGAWLRQSRAAEAERRRHVEEGTRAAERARIARELHDVVTHHVTAMVVQAEAARYLTGDPERLEQTLNAITGTGRRAVGDLRQLLDLLNPDHGTGDPRTPSAGDLDALVDQTRQAGQPVEFVREGTAAATGSAEVAAYRVVQEALTNALKYAHGSPTRVHVRHGKGETTVEISTDGSGSSGASPGGSGRGLAGLRERVTVLGGEFSAGAQAGGGFLVRARIPAGNPS
ncbi:putative two-component system sensor kinase [Actinoplanes missouriensis 431]|uniref:histidine kinase n=1 Tax=Actinoplanes missouriensis (strain ATCC 14538 / DSM 43046 / CBS 188.64 / JCM 3121 / NBRC 102363 / NCIMB 12654 / NRRL B-3342 / UNCC 431) TaxID=512565 RepID=I0HJK4_ACTM4|nr:histidine kinase [Actinoplanes missouriensis]BAL93191.1 putative two-component system sensor kinase [Actinoplanes missouriensis 431]